MSTVWHCCQCGDGPYSTLLIMSCQNCPHRRCGYCQVETTDPQDEGSDIADNQSECSDVACSKPPASVPPNVAAEPTANVFHPFLSTLTTDGVSTVFPPPQNTPNFVRSLTISDLAALDTANNGLNHAQNDGNITQRGGEEEYHWLCCYCRRTWNSFLYDDFCTDVNCRQPRCESCPVEKARRGKQR
jgi:hypothetical protein